MKKLLSITLALLMLLSSYASAAPGNIISPETAQEESQTAEETAQELPKPQENMAALQSAITPGLNILTGTADKKDFEDGTTSDIKVGWGEIKMAGVVDNNIGITGNTSGKILKFSTAGSKYDAISVPCSVEAGRKYEITWDTYYSIKSTDGNNTPLAEFTGWLMHYGSGPMTFGGSWSANLENGTWGTVINTAAPSQARAELNLQYKLGDAGAVATGAGDVYLDNLAVYPYYKITYTDDSGNSASTDQVLRDAGGAFLTSYAPLTTNYPNWTISDGTTRECIGWALTANASTAITSVPLANEDVTLYPVWNITSSYMSAPAILESKAGTAGEIVVTEDTTWEWDVGSTKAVVAPVAGAESRKLSITTAGYAGDIKITATKVSDSSKTEKVIHIAGASKWQPGYNMLTGTTNPYTFEDLTASQISHSMNLSGNNIFIDNPNPTGINTSGKVVRMTGTSYPQLRFPSDLADTIPVERPVAVNFSYMGTFAYMWVMKTGYGAGDIGADLTSTYGTSGDWKNVSWYGMLNNKNTRNTTNIGLEFSIVTTNSVYVDNLSYIPAYKVSYMALDGVTVAATDYVLFDSNGKLLTSYVPDVSKATEAGVYGYSATQGATEFDVSVPLNHEDIVLYPVTSKKMAFTDGTTTAKTDLPISGNYTMPTAQEAGVVTENFRVWIASDGTQYTAGQVIPEAEVTSKLVGKVFTAYYQDATVSAMGFSYEGDVQPTDVNKFKNSTVTMDNGRTALKLVQNATTWDGKKWMNDARITIWGADKAFNSSEYSVFQYSYRVESITNCPSTTAPENITSADLVDKDSEAMIIYYYSSTGGDSYWNPGGEHRVGNKIYTVYKNKSYDLCEVDMSIPSNGNSAAPWATDENSKIYGFAIDPNRASYAGETYIDYVRVYRKGIFTVTYDSNFPEIADVNGATGVEPDTGRGAGTGYLLKGAEPTLPNDPEYVFVGWGLTPDATTPVSSIDLTNSTTVYAVWKSAYPEVSTKASIRVDSKTGLRFMASVTDEQKGMANEYGFIIARKTAIEAASLTTYDLTFDCGVKYVWGASYDPLNKIDRIYDTDASKGLVYFTGVLTGIPDAYVTDVLVGRPYIKVGGTYRYGDPVEKSIYAVAVAVKDGGYNGLDAAGIAVIDHIISLGTPA